MATMKHYTYLAIAIVFSVCAFAVAQETHYKNFVLQFDVVNEVDLVTNKVTPELMLDCTTVKLPRNVNIKYHLVRLYPALERDNPVREMDVRMDLFRIRQNKDLYRSMSMASYPDTPPAVGHYKISMLVPPGQHPRVRKALGDAGDVLGQKHLIFIGTKSRAFDTILKETRHSIQSFEDILSLYSSLLGREYKLDGNGEYVKQKVEELEETVVAKSVNTVGLNIMLRRKALTMPEVYEYLNMIRLWNVQLIDPNREPTLEPMERSIAAVETMVLRESLLNLHYFVADAVERIRLTFEALMSSPNPKLTREALVEWRAVQVSVQSLWSGLKKDFLNENYLQRLEMFSRIGPQYNNLQQFESDCDRFRRVVRDEAFLQTIEDYLTTLAELYEEYATLLEEDVTSDKRIKIKSLRRKMNTMGDTIKNTLRLSGDVLRDIEMQAEEEKENEETESGDDE